ncbi:MAG: hypothetical protein ACJAZP_001883 [Psychromonas sp.]|jgi:hypothetical protein|uniref:hypothetical protein n=1 Tax=Psychromonas sp. TaxID=1884585 RepID=UPI0039E39FCF
MAHSVTIYNDTNPALVDNARVHTWMVLTDGQGNSTYYSYGPATGEKLINTPSRWASAADADFADCHSIGSNKKSGHPYLFYLKRFGCPILLCQSGSLIKTGVHRISKKKMDYIKLKVSEGHDEFYYAGYERNKVGFLDELIGQPMAICFYEDRVGLISYIKKYSEIIYQDQRRMNNYEERRVNQLNRLQESKNNFWSTFCWWVLIPLTLTTYILKKY